MKKNIFQYFVYSYNLRYKPPLIMQGSILLPYLPFTKNRCNNEPVYKNTLPFKIFNQIPNQIKLLYDFTKKK